MNIQTGEASGTDFPRYVYIGRNKMFENKEDYVDIKDGDDIIMSENTCYGMDTDHGDDAGAGVIIHEDSDYVWAINNTIHDCTIGIITTGSTNTHFIGNVIFNIDGSTRPTFYYGGGVAMYFRSSGTVSAINNTIYNCDKGIQIATGVTSCDISNNIISNRSDGSAYDIMTASAGETDVDHTLMWDGSSSRIYWGGTTYSSVSAFNSATSECTNCPREADPEYVSNGTDLSLQNSSPAVDKGEAHPIYTAFFNRYATSIALDINRRSRPYNNLWDIGAYEYNEYDSLKPTPPVSLRVR